MTTVVHEADDRGRQVMALHGVGAPVGPRVARPRNGLLDMWTGMGGPNDITLGKDGIFYIAEQEYDDKPAYICLRDNTGAVLTRLETRHVHGVGVDSRGDIYADLTVDQSVDKFVRVT